MLRFDKEKGKEVVESTTDVAPTTTVVAPTTGYQTSEFSLWKVTSPTPTRSNRLLESVTSSMTRQKVKKEK